MCKEKVLFLMLTHLICSHFYLVGRHVDNETESD